MVAGFASPHFRYSEFQCPHCHVVELDHELVVVLELIREAHGNRPIRILSGYRCPIHNAEVGGASHSQHMLGRAADIGPGVCTPSVADKCGARGVGIKGNWAVHVDVRREPKAHWFY